MSEVSEPIFLTWRDVSACDVRRLCIYLQYKHRISPGYVSACGVVSSLYVQLCSYIQYKHTVSLWYVSACVVARTISVQLYSYI